MTKADASDPGVGFHAPSMALRSALPWPGWRAWFDTRGPWAMAFGGDGKICAFQVSPGLSAFVSRFFDFKPSP